MTGFDSSIEVPPYSAAEVEVVRVPGGAAAHDRVAVEEPLEIRVDGRAVAVTMRTPGHDEELALGFCISEGIPARGASPTADLAANTIDVDADGFDPARVQRNFYTSSSCGVCGKGALEAVAVEARRVTSDLRVPAALIESLPTRLRDAQHAFAVTGGLHATGLFDASGELRCLREDVGRHNAMDKVVGWAFLTDALPLERAILCVSGRLSFELVQKAAVAGCPLVAALPSRLRAAQPTFAATGGLHATGLFDPEGALVCVREDVGRHNAMDKVLGWAFREGRLPLADAVLCVSGRLSFELVQKAAVAGCPIMVAVGAPSSLAVELARDRGVTLCGFVRDGRVNVYSEPWRIR